MDYGKHCTPEKEKQQIKKLFPMKKLMFVLKTL